jgi:hypothetical protein
MPIMFKRQSDAHHLTFAMGEALTYLNKLWIDGVLKRMNSVDGIVRFLLHRESKKITLYILLIPLCSVFYKTLDHLIDAALQ